MSREIQLRNLGGAVNFHVGRTTFAGTRHALRVRNTATLKQIWLCLNVQYTVCSVYSLIKFDVIIFYRSSGCVLTLKTTR